jgi:hypothetical protein
VQVALAHLHDAGESECVTNAIRATDSDTEEDIRELEEDEAMTHRALDLLGSLRNDRYEAALEALHEDTREWWADMLARHPDKQGDDLATPDEAGLHRFLEGEVLPWYETRRTEIANRPPIREQAFGEALDPDKLERLGRDETHLDRKLERNACDAVAAAGSAPGGC